jgi:hypothetical protein
MREGPLTEARGAIAPRCDRGIENGTPTPSRLPALWP